LVEIHANSAPPSLETTLLNKSPIGGTSKMGSKHLTDTQKRMAKNIAAEAALKHVVS